MLHATVKCTLTFILVGIIPSLQVLSPHNLELDSDTSSVAAWSFSMATPTTGLPDVDKDKKVTSSVDISVVSTTTSPCMSEEEEGISSGDESILRLLGKHKSEHNMSLLKIRDKTLMKHKVCNIVLISALICHTNWFKFQY